MSLIVNDPRGFNGPLPKDMREVLLECYTSPVWVQSNTARAFAQEIALAASLGWITVIAHDGTQYSRRWHITTAGLTFLEGAASA